MLNNVCPGPYCQECPTCLDTCDTLKQCVECEAWASGDLVWGVDIKGKQGIVIEERYSSLYPSDHPAVCYETCPEEFSLRYETDLSKYQGLDK